MPGRQDDCMGYGLWGRCSAGAVKDEPPSQHTDITIAGSVGRSGKNRPCDVKTIQRALNQVPIHQGRPSPQLVVDGLNGSKTERAIYIFQKHHFGANYADARVDPGHRTIAKLNELQPATQGAGGSGGSAAGSGTLYGGTSFLVPVTESEKEVMKRVDAAIAKGQKWALKAVIVLLNAIEYIDGKKEYQPSYDLVDRCFKIDSLSTGKQKRLVCNRIIKIFNRFSRARNAVKPFARTGASCTSKEGWPIFAEAIVGGYHSENDDYKRIKICVPNMRGKDVIFMTDAMVHEMAHLVGPFTGPDRIVHGGRKDPAYGLDALKLTHRETLISASNYAWLAWLARLPKSQWLTNKG